MTRRITLLFLLILTFACNEARKEKKRFKSKDSDEKYIELRRYNHLDMINWSKVRVSIEPILNQELKDVIYKLYRHTENESAFFSSEQIPVTNSSEYKLSIKVKKSDRNNLFGLRITGDYPDRVDAVFDLKKGEIVEYGVAQNFQNPIAFIEELPNGWYNCILGAKVSTNKIRIIFGDTSIEKRASNWEGEATTVGGIYFLPSSIILEERN